MLIYGIRFYYCIEWFFLNDCMIFVLDGNNFIDELFYSYVVRDSLKYEFY